MRALGAERAGPATRQQRARVATSAAFVAQGLMFSVLLTHLPQFTDRYGISEGTVTLIVLMVTLLAGVGSLLSELLAAATSSRTALRCGLLVIAAAGAAIGLAPGLLLFTMSFALYGLGLGAVDAGGNMQGVAVQHRYGRSIITSIHAAWSAAAILGALFVAAGERLSISLPGSILPIAGVVLLIALIGGPQLLPLDQPADVIASEAAPLTSSAGAANSTSSAGSAGSADLTSSADSAAASMAESVPDGPVTPTGPKVFSLTSGPMLLLGLAMTCFWSVDAGVSNWSALYLRDLLHASDSTAVLGYALYQTTALVSRLAGDFAVRRLGVVSTVRTGAMVGVIGTLLVVLAPGPVVAIIGFGVAGLGLPVIAPLCFSAAGAAARLAGDHLPESASDPNDAQRALSKETAVDSAIARLNVFNYLGSLLGAVVVGAVATYADLRIGFIIPILLAAAVYFLARAFAPAENP